MPEAALRVFQARLEALREAGFDGMLAAQALRALIAYAGGYGMLELSCFQLSDAGPQAESGELDRLLCLTRTLPPDAPPELVAVAREVCFYDPDHQFGLDLLLGALEQKLTGGR
jgi:hypothetical protein